MVLRQKPGQLWSVFSITKFHDSNIPDEHFEFMESCNNGARSITVAFLPGLFLDKYLPLA
jgi:hypothetical protein